MIVYVVAIILIVIRNVYLQNNSISQNMHQIIINFIRLSKKWITAALIWKKQKSYIVLIQNMI